MAVFAVLAGSVTVTGSAATAATSTGVCEWHYGVTSGTVWSAVGRNYDRTTNYFSHPRNPFVDPGAEVMVTVVAVNGAPTDGLPPAFVSAGDVLDIAVDRVGFTNETGIPWVGDNVDLHSRLELVNATVETDEVVENPGPEALGRFRTDWTYPTVTHSVTVDPSATGTLDISVAAWDLVAELDFLGFLSLEGRAECSVDPGVSWSIPIGPPTSGSPIAVDDLGAQVFWGGAPVSFPILNNDRDPVDPAGVFGCDPASSIDPYGVVLDLTGTVGVVSWDPVGCLLTYDPGASGVPSPAGFDSFTYTVTNTGGSRSNSASVTVPVGNARCSSASASGPFNDNTGVTPPADTAGITCSLNQLLLQKVIGVNLTLQQSGATTVQSDVVSDGATGTATAALNELVVADARGNPTAPWNLTMSLVGDLVRKGGSAEVETDVIARSRMRSLNHGCSVVDGEDSTVLGGGGEDTFGEAAIPLCRAPAASSGGTFKARADLALTLPDGAKARDFRGTLQFNLF